MKSLSTTLTGMAVAAAALLAMPAQAVTITFGGQAATDGSKLTSSLVPANNIQLDLNGGVFVETFDLATRNPILAALGFTGTQAASPQPGIQIEQGVGASFNSYGSVAVTTTGGGVGIGQSYSGAAAPAGDTTNFGFGPGWTTDGNGNRIANGTVSTITIDYAPFLAFLIGAGLAPVGSEISYLGLYYGSIDTYNNLSIFGASGSPITGAGILSDGVIEGAEVLAAQGGTSGDQFGPGSNVYVNFNFDAGESFTKFTFSTTGVAFELDNLVIGLTTRYDVPEPASLALLGLGLLGVAGFRRRSIKKA